MPDDLCDLCCTSGVSVDRVTYCGLTIGNECGCADDCETGCCTDRACERCAIERKKLEDA